MQGLAPTQSETSQIDSRFMSDIFEEDTARRRQSQQFNFTSHEEFKYNRIMKKLSQDFIDPDMDPEQIQANKKQKMLKTLRDQKFRAQKILKNFEKDKNKFM